MTFNRIVLVPTQLLCITALVSIGCQQRIPHDFNPPKVSTPPSSPIVALIGSQPIRVDDLWGSLLEIGGEQVMQEIVLRVALELLLEQQNITIVQTHLDDERSLLSTSAQNTELDNINDMLQSKGYGKNRLKQLLWRNAALRSLIAMDVDVTEEAVERMYSIIHGSAYPVKINVLSTLQEANAVTAKLRQGVSFSELAVEYSIDSSSAYGGLVNPISIADPTWPSPIREALPNLDVGNFSTPILIGDRWVILKAIGEVTQSGVQFEEVASEMRRLATLAQERFLMEELAITLVNQQSPTLFDDDLRRVLRSHHGNSK